jgi:hypothetical protein
MCRAMSKVARHKIVKPTIAKSRMDTIGRSTLISVIVLPGSQWRLYCIHLKCLIFSN